MKRTSHYIDDDGNRVYRIKDDQKRLATNARRRLLRRSSGDRFAKAGKEIVEAIKDFYWSLVG